MRILWAALVGHVPPAAVEGANFPGRTSRPRKAKGRLQENVPTPVPDRPAGPPAGLSHPARIRGGTGHKACRVLWAALAGCVALASAMAAEFRAPAGTRPAIRTEAGPGTILPGGRLLTPYGTQFTTGPGPFGLAISPDDRRVVTANSGPDYFSLSFLEEDGGAWKIRNVHAPAKRDEDDHTDSDDEWHSTFMGLAFESDHVLYASDGESGRVRAIDPGSGRTLQILRLNGGGFRDSFSGDLALDATRRILYVVDQTNFRVVVFDLHTRERVASVRVGRLPFAIALSPDAQRLYVTSIGMFEYKALPGVDPKNPQDTGLPF